MRDEQRQVVYLNITDNYVECFGKTRDRIYSARYELSEHLTADQRQEDINCIKKEVFQSLYAMQKWKIDMNTVQGKKDVCGKSFPYKIIYPIIEITEDVDL